MFSKSSHSYLGYHDKFFPKRDTEAATGGHSRLRYSLPATPKNAPSTPPRGFQGLSGNRPPLPPSVPYVPWLIAGVRYLMPEDHPPTGKPGGAHIHRRRLPASPRPAPASHSTEPTIARPARAEARQRRADGQQAQAVVRAAATAPRCAQPGRDPHVHDDGSRDRPIERVQALLRIGEVIVSDISGS